MSIQVSFQTGFGGWTYPSDPGMELLGMVAYNSSYTGMRWGMTYIPEPDTSYNGGAPMPYYDPTYTIPQWIQNFDTAVRYPKAGQTYPGVSNAASIIRNSLETGFCPAIDTTVYGALGTTALTNASVTVCVYNCGVMPWRFSRTYAAAGSGSPPVTVPYQRFSMAFSGINTLDFQTNNHIAFNRDLFQLR